MMTEERLAIVEQLYSYKPAGSIHRRHVEELIAEVRFLRSPLPVQIAALEAEIARLRAQLEKVGVNLDVPLYEEGEEKK